jgi:hypothetical protein
MVEGSIGSPIIRIAGRPFFAAGRLSLTTLARALTAAIKIEGLSAIETRLRPD